MIRMLIPLGIFVGLVALLLVSLETAEQRKLVASPLVGRPVPTFTLPQLHDPQARISTADFSGQPYIINVWGSWCWACRVEHPFVERLGAESGIPLVGFNWKDERDDALQWLNRYGDAWTDHMVDFEGRAAIDLGVYGAPETFLVDHQGIIRHKHIGPIDANVFEDLMRRILEMRSEVES
jgi:cytochrome c biogenesis protein CcmG, thiol:disulfide interchange protein DsbE